VLPQIDGIDIPESLPKEFKAHPAVYTIHNEETTVVPDIQGIASSQHWPENPHHEGFHSIGVFPIWDGTELSNVLLVYAARPYAFSFNERLLFEELCRDIAYTKQALQTNNQVREQQEQLAKRNLEWEVLNRIVRHDIRNKMAVIIGRTELLAESLTEDYSEHIEPILSSSRQVVEITKEARDVSEALATSGKIELKPVQVSGILQTAVEGVQEMFPEVTIQISDESEGVSVMANGLVSAVFRNVLTNAVMHNPSENPEIDVSTVLNDETVVITIADNGIGFPPAVREKVFGSDLEISGDQGVGQSAGTGHGIGLTLVVSLVSQFGGDIWVEENDAGGSSVSIELNRA
jgi:Signal transduction histidine kinase